MKTLILGNKKTRIPYIVFLIGMLFTLTFYWQLNKKIERNHELVFSDHVREIQFTITHYLDGYREVMFGLQAFFQHAEQDISRQDFHDYLQNFKTNENYTSFRSIAFLRHVNESNYDQVLTRLKAEKILLYPSFFELNPTTQQKDLISDKKGSRIIFDYVEPFNPSEQKAIGFNVLSEPKRSAALTHARLVNAPTASAPINFIYDKQKKTTPNAFFIVLPVYKNQKFLGMIGTGFSVDKLFDRIFKQYTSLSQIGLKITDVGGNYEETKKPPIIIFDNIKERNISGLHRQFSVVFAERNWQIDIYEIIPSTEAMHASISTILLIIGTIISSILFFISFMIINELNKSAQILLETQKQYDDIKVNAYTLNSVINSLDEVIWLMPSNRSRYIFISPSAERLFGKSLEYMYTHSKFLFEMIHPDDKERIIAHTFSSINFHKNHDLTYRIVLDDQTEKWLSESWQIIYDDTGDERYIGKIIDITLQKNIEARFSDQQDQFTHLFNQSLDGIFIIDNGRIVECNHAFVNLMQQSHETILHQSLLALSSKNTAAATHLKTRYNELLSQALNKGYIRTDWLFITLDQTEIPCDLSFTTVQIQGKQCLICFCRDMRSSKRLQAMLKQSAEDYRLVFNTISDAIFIRDVASLEIIEVNEYACELYGYSAPEWIHLNLKKLSARQPKENFAIAENHLELAKNGEPQHFEWQARKKNNINFWIEVNVSCIQMREKTCLLFLVRDINTQKQIEKKLQQAKDTAEQANRAKTLFLANMSHALRKPLGAILGMTDLLVDKNISEEQAEFNNIIKKSSLNLLKMISNILEFTKIDLGEIQLDFESVILQELMNDIVQQYTQIVSQKNIKFQYIYAPNLPVSILCDTKRLKQILSLLIENALKFTMEGNITISLQIQQQRTIRNKPQLYLHFTISDTGSGIDPEQLARINYFFSQTESGEEQTYGGIGLGLAITTQLVQLMQGKIWAESIPRQGSHFHFTILVQNV